MFRLHIDIPLGENEETAVKAVLDIISKIPVQMILNDVPNKETAVFQYRLSQDDDRTIKNYLIKNENNHVGRTKTVITRK